MRSFRVVLTVAVVVAAGFGVWFFAGKSNPLSAQSTEPPAALTSPFYPYPQGFTIEHNDLKMTSLDFDTLPMQVSIRRTLRDSPTSPWSQQETTFSCSYYVIDARAMCTLDRIYVTGVYPNGTTTIEEWTLVDEELPPIPHVPLAQRPHPRTNRRVLYMGTTLGHVQSLVPDPEGRFLVVFTYEGHELYKFPLPSGSPVRILTPAELPVLASMRSVLIKQSVTYGRVLLLLDTPLWHHVDPGPTNHWSILLPDSDNDGTFEAPIVHDSDGWVAEGLHLGAAWTSPCPP